MSKFESHVAIVAIPVHDGVYRNQTSLYMVGPLVVLHVSGGSGLELVACSVEKLLVPSVMSEAFAHSSLAGGFPNGSQEIWSVALPLSVCGLPTRMM